MAENMTTGDDDKDDADLYTMDDDKSDGEGVLMPTVIVEDEPGSVVLIPVNESATKLHRKKVVPALEDVELDDEGSDDDKDDDDGMGWEDAYEQEI